MANYTSNDMNRLVLFTLFFVSLTALLSFNAFSQPKYEKEIRIRKREVPENALRFIDSMKLNSRVKWYKEIGYDQISYEAKTRVNRKRVSIEFCELGSLQDVEIQISPNDIPTIALTSIKDYLSLKYDRFKIEKVQVQYSGADNQILIFFISNMQNSDNLEIRYEFVISSRVEGSFKLFEYLFSNKGEYIKSAPIIQRRTDVIDY